MFTTFLKGLQQRGKQLHGFWIYRARLATTAIEASHETIGVQGINGCLNGEINIFKRLRTKSTDLSRVENSFVDVGNASGNLEMSGILSAHLAVILDTS
jgi:hypothetical protein